MRSDDGGETYDTMGAVTDVDANFVISKIFATTTAGLIFVVVLDSTTNVHYLLRSADGGATFANVLTLGDGNGLEGADTPWIRVWLHGFAEMTVDYPGGGGTGDLILGEYNANDSRTPGSTNDRVRVMRSTDDGETWSAVMTWNTDGSVQNTNHVHTVLQDPLTGYVYVTTGDPDTKNGVIRWDGASAFVDNTPMASVAALDGFDCLTGAQRYRVVDLAFTANYVFSMADTYGASDPDKTEGGIWRGVKDLSEAWERVDNSIISIDEMQHGWDAFVTSDGVLVITSGKGYNWTRQFSPIYMSSGTGAVWKRPLEMNWSGEDVEVQANTRYAHMLLDKIYLDNTDCDGGGTRVLVPAQIT